MTDIIETIYADCFSTTPIDNRVVERMHQLYSTTIGNPSSSSHEYGRAANRVVQSSRETVANMINCSKNEIIFTSGATEGNNLVLVGTAKQLAKTSERRTILYSAIEHPAVIEPLQKLRSEGFDVIKIKCKSTGLVDIDDLTEKLDQNVLMVSIMLVNNELGTIQPIQQLSKLVHEAGALIHTDAAQAIGKIPVDVKVLDVDILTGSSHKMYGPTGVGFVFLRGGSNSFPIAPLFHGGGQENEIRPGTLNAIGIAGFAEACNIAMNEMVKERNRLERIRDNIEEKLLTVQTE